MFAYVKSAQHPGQNESVHFLRGKEPSFSLNLQYIQIIINFYIELANPGCEGQKTSTYR